MQQEKRKQYLNYLYLLVGIVFLLSMLIISLLNRNGSSNPLTIVEILPVETVVKSPWTVIPITFRFNTPVDVSTAEYKVEPQVNTRILEQSNVNELTIIPLDGWDENTQYTVTLTKLDNFVGGSLKEPVSKTFERQVDLSDFVDHGEENYNLEDLNIEGITN